MNDVSSDGFGDFQTAEKIHGPKEKEEGSEDNLLDIDYPEISETVNLERSQEYTNESIQKINIDSSQENENDVNVGRGSKKALIEALSLQGAQHNMTSIQDAQIHNTDIAIDDNKL